MVYFRCMLRHCVYNSRHIRRMSLQKCNNLQHFTSDIFRLNKVVPGNPDAERIVHFCQMVSEVSEYIDYVI